MVFKSIHEIQVCYGLDIGAGSGGGDVGAEGTAPPPKKKILFLLRGPDPRYNVYRTITKYTPLFPAKGSMNHVPRANANCPHANVIRHE